MNNFLEEKEKLLNSIEQNTSEHWKEYYKNVPIECIYDDLVIDINEIKRLQEKLNKISKAIEIQLEIIKDQPSQNETDDKYWLETLKGFQKIINEGDIDVKNP